jgi:hypothetical protein
MFYPVYEQLHRFKTSLHYALPELRVTETIASATFKHSFTQFQSAGYHMHTYEVLNQHLFRI